MQSINPSQRVKRLTQARENERNYQRHLERLREIRIQLELQCDDEQKCQRNLERLREIRIQLELQCEFDRVQLELQRERELQLEQLRLIPTKPTQNEFSACSICLVNEKNVVYSCGHVMCPQCAKNLQKQECPFCKKPLENPRELFL